VTPTFIFKALAGEPVPLENDGIPTRDFIYVEDVVKGLTACALHGAPGDVYNIASGVETSIRDLALKINAIAGNAAGVEPRPRRPWDNSGKRFGSTAKAERELGWLAVVPLEEGLTRTIAWTRENFALVQATMRKHDAHMRAAARS
jgi:UDP-glucose 4-epimerase